MFVPWLQINKILESIPFPKHKERNKKCWDQSCCGDLHPKLSVCE